MKKLIILFVILLINYEAVIFAASTGGGGRWGQYLNNAILDCSIYDNNPEPEESQYCKVHHGRKDTIWRVGGPKDDSDPYRYRAGQKNILP